MAKSFSSAWDTWFGLLFTADLAEWNFPRLKFLANANFEVMSGGRM